MECRGCETTGDGEDSPEETQGGILMTITVQANNFSELLHKLGRADTSPIKIRFRLEDFGRKRLPGCIVDATGLGEEVAMSFSDEGAALAYLEKMLRK
jgi:hypothetical protein